MGERPSNQLEQVKRELREIKEAFEAYKIESERKWNDRVAGLIMAIKALGGLIQ